MRILIGCLLSWFFLVSTHTRSQSIHWKRVGKPSKNTSEFVKGDVKEGQAFIAARTQECRWADAKGNLWVFGGSGYDVDGQYGIFQDLWRFNPKNNNWQLIKGKGNSSEKEIDKDPSWPAGRRNASTWCDKNGNLWLFGGKGMGDLFHLNDMWVFETNKGQWRKIQGSNSVNDKPTYDRLNESAKNSSPGGRSGSSTWVDNDDNLWLFGGESQEGKNMIAYNDLWQFDQKKELWRKIAGADKPNQTLDSNSISTGSKKIDPSSRRGAIAWYDKTKNQLYLYGGFGFGVSSGQQGGLADMWAYDIKGNSWSIKSRNFQVNSDQVNFSAGALSPKNTPGSRHGAVSWIDGAGNFYLMGGHSILYSESTFVDPYVWKYDITKGMWVMVLDSESVVLNGGTVFAAADGSVYLYGGNEFDKQKKQSYPVTSIWLLEQK
ncbi:hypothetical protein LZD49_13460 [Dyadobacter sp. CY261]|uniref:kelch repeat-containing protein n=1 Tax=Dyadobacter sp. CY261 TaxID=2907203 RepID=UPI001F43CF5C|nr:kelch repeat-containing protein [Dyadobacter sp. CY261]MCF0071483.1 hypothetical protein [Dyadobacter sp. CY261]